MGVIATWGQLTNESDLAYAAFKVYRNAGIARSLRSTARVVGKSKSMMEKWSRRHKWVARVAAWDLEQQDLHKEARIQAISDAEERHGKLARALLGRVAAELGTQVKGRCQSCGRSPTKLTGAQVARALKAGVEVERLALGQSTAGSSTITQNNTTAVHMSATTALVLLRDPASQRLASELLSRMRSLDPATSLRRLAGQQAATALKRANGAAVTGHSAVNAARAQALEDRRAHLGLASDPSGPDRTAAEELERDDVADVADVADEAQLAADEQGLQRAAKKVAHDRKTAAQVKADPVKLQARRERQAKWKREKARRLKADDDGDLFDEGDDV